MEINNKYLSTTSKKIKNISMLLKYVHEKIMENQNIKRMMYFNSRNPLSVRGIGYDGSKVDQPDVTDEQVEDLITLLPFNPQMKIEKVNSIFLNIPMASFYSSGNQVYFEVSIVTPVEYFEISNGVRLYEISHEIVNMFDGLCIEDLTYELGNSRFFFEDIVIERLSSNSDSVYASIRFKADIVPFNKTRGV